MKRLSPALIIEPGDTIERPQLSAKIQDPATTQTTDACHLIAIQPAAGKGLGLFATADIPAGTCILREKPLLITKADSPKSVLKAFRELSADNKKRFLQLSPSREYEDEHNGCFEELGATYEELGTEVQRILAIEDTNSWRAGEEHDVTYHLGSRLNHSCFTNVILNILDVDHGYEAVAYTSANVAKGEELVVSYILNDARDKTDRAVELLEWNITCKCEACMDDERGQEHERRRARMREMLSTGGNIRDHKEARVDQYLAEIEVLLDDFEHERIFHRGYQEIAADLADYYEEKGKPEEAIKWISRWADWARKLHGPKNCMYRHFADARERLAKTVAKSEEVEENDTEKLKVLE